MSKIGAGTGVISVTIANAVTTSGAFDTKHFQLAGLIFATMTGTIIKFHASDTLAGTYVVVKDDAGTDYSITISDDHATGLGDVFAAMSPFRFLKLVSDQSEGAERTIKVILKT